MKFLFPIWVGVFVVSSCAKAPALPDKAVQATSSDASVDQDIENHEDHGHEEAAGAASAPVSGGTVATAASPHAADMDLLNSWNKGQYIGNEQLQLSYLATVPLQ